MAAADGRLPFLSDGESPRRKAARVFNSSWSGRSSYAVAPVTAGCLNKFKEDGGNSDNDDEDAGNVVVSVAGSVVSIVIAVIEGEVAGDVEVVADDNNNEEEAEEERERVGEEEAESHSMSTSILVSVGRRGENLKVEGVGALSAILLLLLVTPLWLFLLLL